MTTDPFPTTAGPPDTGPARAGVLAPVHWWLMGWRDRLLASPRFRRWSLATPLVKRTARRHADHLFDLCAGFVYSQVLLVCVRARLLERVAQARHLSRDEVAALVGLDRRRADALIQAAIALDLLAPRGPDRVRLGMAGAGYVGTPGLAAMVEHHALVYRDLAEPLALFRGDAGETEVARFWRYAGADDPDGAVDGPTAQRYSALMAATQVMFTQEILGAYRFKDHRRILDVGGGEGRFAQSLAEHLGAGPELLVFDLPAVADAARARLAGLGLGERVRVTGGDFRGPDLPRGADLVCLIRVLFDHDDNTVLALLRAVRGAMPPGGTLLIAEAMARPEGRTRATDAYWTVYLLAMGQGRMRTAEQIEALLARAGFEAPRRFKTRQPDLISLITCRNPGEAVGNS